MNYSLLQDAKKYTSLGYKVGITSGKSLVDTYDPVGHPPLSWDGISIILEGLVCVDFDSHLSMDCGYGNDLPSTWKERTPRGVHLFYLLPIGGGSYTTKIKWKQDIDLLTKSSPARATRYGKSNDPLFAEHVLCSSTPGYIRVYPNETPTKNQLTLAPDWLLEELK